MNILKKRIIVVFQTKQKLTEENKENNKNQLSFDLGNIEQSEINNKFDEYVEDFNNKKNIYDEKIKVKEEEEYQKRVEEGLNYLNSEDWELWSHVFDKSEAEVKREWEEHLENKVFPKIEKMIDEEINKI